MMPLLRPPPGINDGNVPTIAADLARHLRGGRKSGRQWVACCPAHNDREPSLSIGQGDDGRVLIHCFAGCGQEEVINALRARGLWSNGAASRQRPITQRRYRERSDRADTGTAELVNRIWREGCDPHGTVAEKYLDSRKLSLPPELRVVALRFHPACPWEGGFAQCLIAAFRSIVSDQITAIHRIRVDRPDAWPKTQRRMLGPVIGSAIKFDAAGNELAVGEGLETVLAARQLGLRPCWALGYVNAIAAFPLIKDVEHLLILGENDNGASRSAADQCRAQWKQRCVSIITPRRSKDMNDIL
jgi:hypothetical protein